MNNNKSIELLKANWKQWLLTIGVSSFVMFYGIKWFCELIIWIAKLAGTIN